MQICTNCSAKQLDGTIFCLDCGASMTASNGIEATRDIGAGNAPQTEGLQARAAAHTTESVLAPLTLILAHNGRRLTLDVSDEVLIGRADTARGLIPDIDLGAEGGYDAGVSRRHAILSQRNGAYIIEDLGSANGTFVNGRRLTAQAAVPLNHGDELKCGTLVLLIEIGG